MKLREGIPNLEVDFTPIIEASAFQFPIVERKAKRLHQMQCRFRGQTKSADVAGVWRNLRLDQNNVEHHLFL